MPLIYLSCAWVTGIFLGSKFNLPSVLMLTALIPLPLLFPLSKHRKAIIMTSLCLIILFGGAFYFQSSLPATDETSLQFYNDKGTVEIKGIVDRDPEIREKTTHLRLSATEIKVGEKWQEISEPRCQVKRHEEVSIFKKTSLSS